MKYTLLIPLITVFSLIDSKSVDIPRVISPCPVGSRPLLRPDGQPRKCLPHQNSLCVNALPDKPNADTVCCYNNQVDYFCCLDATAEQCPDYHQVTVVIHNSFPQNPFALKSFFFREGIEDEISEGAQDGINKEDGILVRHNNNNNNNNNINNINDNFHA